MEYVGRISRSKHHRLKGYDYSSPGVYFITICAFESQHLFGEIINGKMILNKYGEIVHENWAAIPDHFDCVYLDEFVVMPNHIHGLICRGTACRARTLACRARPMACRARTSEEYGQPVPGSIPTIVRSFKSSVTHQINRQYQKSKNYIWHRNYYDHIIRNDEELSRVRMYIRNNPINWKNIGTTG